MDVAEGVARDPLLVAHEEFRSVASEPGDGWNGHLWRAECKGCSWRGPLRPHPLDTGSDAVEHFEAPSDMIELLS